MPWSLVTLAFMGAGLGVFVVHLGRRNGLLRHQPIGHIALATW